MAEKPEKGTGEPGDPISPTRSQPVCPSMPFVKDQVAVVTGASSGIGRSIAIALAEAGADVVVNYFKNEEAGEEVVSIIEKSQTPHAGRGICVQADVSTEDGVDRLFSTAVEEFSRVDILVSNAGVQRDASIEKMTLDQWSQVIDTNLTGTFLSSRAAIRTFRSQEIRKGVSCAAGKIICTGSVHEFIPWAQHANYAASKGGLRMFVKSLAQEAAKHCIRVNALTPGAIKTPINEDAWKDEEARRELLKLIPYNRVGETKDVAHAAVWLASDYADYITGESLVIDGGMSLYPGFAAGSG